MSAPRRAGGVLDLDLHSAVPGALEVLFPYLPSSWRRRLEERGMIPLPAATLSYRRAVFGNEPDGCTDPRQMLHEHFDRHDVEAGLLTSLQACALDGLLDRAEAMVLARAFTDYHVDRWLSVDPRLRLAAVVPTRDPTLAVAEIERVAAIPGVAAVCLPLSDRLLGSPHYEPMIAAAHDARLALIAHPSTNYGHSSGSPLYGGGVPASDAERVGGMPSIAMGNISSLIWEGTFQRHPKLRVVFVEYDWDWLAVFAWKLDAVWRSARQNTPWLRHPPSHYLAEHVRLTTDPAFAARDEAFGSATLELGPVGRVLCFGSDYPFQPAPDPAVLFAGSSPELRRRLLRGNAVEAFGGATNALGRGLMPGEELFTLGTVEDFSEGRARILEVGGRSIGVYRLGEEFFAVQNVCPHALAPICEGTLGGTFLPAEGPGDWIYGLHNRVLRCPYHRWEFDIASGESLFGVDRRKLLTFPVSVELGEVRVRMRPRPGHSSSGRAEA